MLAEITDDPESQSIITGEETWVYVYDTEMEAQSSQWELHEERGRTHKTMPSLIKCQGSPCCFLLIQQNSML